MSEIVDNIEYQLKSHLEDFESITAIVNPEGLRGEISEIEKEFSENPNIWDTPAKANELNKKLHGRKKQMSIFEELQNCKDEILFSLDLYKEDADDSLVSEIQKGFDTFVDLIAKANLKFLLNGEFDHHNCIITIHPGAGGTESCDWASMLYRMYQRFSESSGFKVKELDFQPGDVAGIKSVTALIEGDYAYGHLKGEAGVHRLVRISPFDSSARRHTSFCSVDVSPEVDENIEIEIDPKDLKIDLFCASGPGGQGVNTTYSAVRLTHLPSGIVVNCQNERSQLHNKQTAMNVLKSRLFELELKKRQEEAMKAQSEKLEIGWGSQIRSYVLHPYQLVKDHRNNQETGATDKVLDGALDDFISAYLKWINMK
jgi:peptide chain release factor 2